MKPILLSAAALGLSIAGAQACSFHKTADHGTTTVASIDADQAPMSTVDDEVLTGSVEKPAKPVEQPAD